MILDDLYEGRNGDVPVYYFAYGMLTDPQIMGDSELVGVGELRNFEYEMFAYANVNPTPGRSVYGCLWAIDRQFIASLDRIEGYPSLYDRRTVPVYIDGKKYAAEVYIMTPATREDFYDTQPTQNYVNRIVRGYRAAGVPMFQLERAVQVSGIASPDRRIDNDPSPWADIDESIVNETTEQDQILVHVAEAATQRILDLFADKESNFLNAKVAFDPSLFLSRRDRLTWFSGLYLKQLYLPEVSDPTINRMINTVKVRLSNHYKDEQPSVLGSYIIYDNGAKAIELYLPRIEEVASEVGHVPADMIRSTFIHEMQHALDDIKSRGKFDSEAGQPKSTTGNQQQQYIQYLKLPHEINARFTQAILDIALQYNTVEGPHRLQDLITKAFANHNLNVASKREYKHLMSRAYKFFDAMQRSPKKIEPKSLAQRAIAWITSQPASTIK